jgi:hypothetical protein
MSKQYFYFLMYPSGDRTRIQVQELSKDDDPKSHWDTVDDTEFASFEEARTAAQQIARGRNLSYELFEPRYVDSLYSDELEPSGEQNSPLCNFQFIQWLLEARGQSLQQAYEQYQQEMKQ